MRQSNSPLHRPDTLHKATALPHPARVMPGAAQGTGRCPPGARFGVRGSRLEVPRAVGDPRALAGVVTAHGRPRSFVASAAWRAGGAGGAGGTGRYSVSHHGVVMSFFRLASRVSPTMSFFRLASRNQTRSRPCAALSRVSSVLGRVLNVQLC